MKNENKRCVDLEDYEKYLKSLSFLTSGLMLKRAKDICADFQVSTSSNTLVYPFSELIRKI